jgi:polar amino acid transport system substrate-binding protein
VLTEHLPPYQIAKGQDVSGFATEVIRKTFDNAKVPYQIDVMSWSRAYQLALRQPNVCIYSISKSAERTPLFHWIGAISYNITAIYSLQRRDDIQINTLDDAKKYVTAVTRDDITHHYLQKKGFAEGKNLYLLENVSAMLNMLQGRKDIDLVVINETILKYRAQESGVPLTSLKKQLELPELPLDFHLACSLKTKPQVVSQLTQALKQLKSSGEFEHIVKDWSEKF